MNDYTELAINTMDDLRESGLATISMKTAARLLGVDVRTVSAGTVDGTIPSIRLGRRVLIPREKFLALFSA